MLMEKLRHNEKTSSKLCKKWIVIEKCSWCIFEALCTYERNVKNVKNMNMD
jgi:hypothetical protein